MQSSCGGGGGGSSGGRRPLSDLCRVRTAVPPSQLVTPPLQQEPDPPCVTGGNSIFQILLLLFFFFCGGGGVRCFPGYNRCCVVGHDWGGTVAWLFAIQHPEMVTKLIVLNCPHPSVFTGRKTPSLPIKRA